MADNLEAAPVLSTPDTRILEETAPASTKHPINEPLSDEELGIIYDIERTLREIREGKWRRVALQFPDEMLSDAPRVFQLLSRGIASDGEINVAVSGVQEPTAGGGHQCGCATNGPKDTCVEEVADSVAKNLKVEERTAIERPRFYILGDTSYGSCCVDEVAAEHVQADVVVHYGRACLSPTARLPVIHVFTHRNLDHDAVVQAFEETYPTRDERIILAADVMYAHCVEAVASTLTGQKGYTNVFPTSILHNPSSPIPNRTTPKSVQDQPETLKSWQLFYISDPPTSLLLTLSSRVAAVRIYPTDQNVRDTKPGPKTVLASTASSLRRRYAILTSLNTVPVFGILINTLSVKNYLHIVEHVQKLISAAGKKSYMFVVGKLNAAKVANFSEIGGWVVIGCWESSLVDSKDFWKPIITPYELELALQNDSDRIWTGEWNSDYQVLLDPTRAAPSGQTQATDGEANGELNDDGMSESESEPPEFDLRTGRYITRLKTRPMQNSTKSSTAKSSAAPGSKSLAKRLNGDVATIGGVVSPAAEYLRSNRTWGGLGSDFVIQYEDDGDANKGGAIVEGRAGIARGYTAGEDQERR